MKNWMSMTTLKPAARTMMALLCLGMAACSTPESGARAGADEVSDPFEAINRNIFAFNEAIDDAVMEPVIRGYRAITPKEFRDSVHNVLVNLRTPVNFANQVLQGDVEGAATDVGRLVVNTIFGIGGIIDVGEKIGLPNDQEDFGQTLASWGVGHGPYVVLPLIGPASVRDHAGMAVDSFADPVRLYLFNTDQENIYYGLLGVKILDTREGLQDVLSDLQRNSLDYYAAVRSVYYQRREALQNDQKPNSGMADIPDYDEE